MDWARRMQAMVPVPQPDPRPGMLQTNEPWALTRLSAADETRFQSDFQASPFYQEFVQRYGERPDTEGDYDYRGWWKETGINATRHDDGTLHGPSKSPSGKWLKSPNHPTAWMENFWRLTGQNPEELGLQSVEDARAYLKQRRRR